MYDGLHKRNKNKLLLILPFMKFPFYGFIRIGIGIAIGIGCFTTGHILGFHGFWFQGFKVSGFQVSRFHPNRGRYRYRYRDRSFNHEHTGWHCSGFYPQIYTDYADFLGHRSGFWGTPEGIPDFHEVSCVSWFHPNRGRDRDRYRDRLFHHKTQEHTESHGFVSYQACGINCGRGSKGAGRV